MNNIASTADRLQTEIEQSRETLSKLAAQDSKLDGNLKELREAMETKLNHNNNTKNAVPAINE
jgi:chaperonin cofactor prefoldin